MMKIEMVDLRTQYERLNETIDKGIAQVLEETSFINGPEVKRFELELSNYLGIEHVIPCANGTDALQVALMALGLQPGDEVITTDFTFIATVEVLALLGLTPVLVDVNPFTYNLDIDEVRKAISPKTKAIVPVHLFGQPADMVQIMELADSHGIFVVEDSAQAIGAEIVIQNGEIVKAGTIGHFGTTSFFPSKNLGCYGDGGALFTHDSQLAERARMIVNHGSKVKYYHDIVGVNSRLDSLQAAILRAKLPHLDSFNQRRKEAADYYDLRFQGSKEIQIPYRAAGRTHVFHQYTIRILNGKRDEIKQALSTQGIPSMVYYPVPSHDQKAFKSIIREQKDYPVTNQVCQDVLSLPMHSELTREQQDYIVEQLLNLI